MNWGAFALTVTGVIVLLWAWQVRKRRWAWPGLIASLGCLFAASLNSAAPFRGLIDPAYMGYVFGLLSDDRGTSVTLFAGPIFIAATASALIAASRTRGPALWVVAVTCAALSVILGVPTLATLFDDSAANSIQFGEYLTVPDLLSTILLVTVLTVPFLLGTVWAARGALRGTA